QIRYNSVWGWADTQDNKEYAVIGSSAGTYFIDVTIPTAPVVRDFVPGRRDSCIWREYKTYQNYLYAVSDDGAPNSLQIIDMSYLPDSVKVVYDQDTLVQRSHSIFIDEMNARMYLNSVYLPKDSGHSNMAVFSLANPINPVLLRRLEQDYTASNNVHDCYVRNDTCYASSGFGGLFIYKLTPSDIFSLTGSLTSYPQQGYNHSSALTANSKTLIFADEVPENVALKSLDVSDLGNLTVLDTFRPSPGDSSTAHNPFIRKGDNSRAVVAHYQSGVQIFDITNPSNVTRTGFFDTAPADCPTCPNPDYSGCWGAYVDLPSGIILASDMQNGLFVLDAGAALGVAPVLPNEISVDLYPNPFTHDFQITLSLVSGENISFELSDISGKVIFKNQMSFSAGSSTFIIDGKNLSAGTYLLNVKGESFSKTEKIIKINK
ncbi:MAG: choice-of-anchor B family protein, partial [Bacteroidetes bacterium]